MFLIFDTETTGLPKNFTAPISDSDNWPRMVQISWQLHDKNGILLENHDYIIKPDGYDIPFASTRIHGISTQMATEEGKDLQDILEKFNQVLTKTKVIAGHNIEFDYNIIGAEFYRKNIDNHLQKIPSVDTMKLGTDFCALPGGRGGKYKSPKLEELFEKLFGYKFDEAHNAAADVNSTAQIFFEMIRKGIIPQKKIFFTDEQLTDFLKTNTQPFSPFDIKIRKQVNTLKKKEKKHPGNFENIDLGNYFNFHNHSIYSALQSTTRISDLIDHAVQEGFPAVGMVDLGNMMGAFKFISEVENKNKNLKNENIKELIPVLGCEFYLSERPEQKQFTKEDPDKRTQVVLLAKNANGYKNLAKLSSLGYINGLYAGIPRISKKQIAEYKQDLIALTGGIYGDIPSTILNIGEKKGEEIFLWWLNEFRDDFFVQIQNHGLNEEDYINNVLLELAEKYNVKILAQNETFYSLKSDSNIQDILSCIKDGDKLSTPIGKGFGKRKSLETDQYHLQSFEEIKKTFSQYPQAFYAYSDFLRKFEPYTLKRDVLLPKFDIPKEFYSDDDDEKKREMAYLRYLTYRGAEKKYSEITPKIKERLDFELEIIEKTGYPGYFLIVQDFCNEAKKIGVSVGPGRGSAAGSAVAYCTGITNIDPIEYNLLFERFLNPERISMPDIDIDFDDEGRDHIIKWVIDKYGQNQVAQIITYSVLGGKSAIKDAGRVLDIPISDTNNIAKLVPSVPTINIEKALKNIDKLKPEDQLLVKEMKEILENPNDRRFTVLDSARKMEGCIRNTGIHACGVIIAPEDISNLVPVSIATKDTDILVSQFDNSVAEHAGLLKMDFLGLKTLTIIKDTIKLIKQNHNVDINPDKIPLDDEKTYQLFKEGRTIGVFQYESAGMQKYMRDLQPTVFADLIAMNALYRPGPIKYIPNFINRKHGIEPIIYDLPETEEYLKETYGITVYQEQVMLLSQKLANFTKGQADTLRKAMGKKQKDVLDKMYPKFIDGGKANQLDEKKLNKIWKDWEAFAEYAFNKSHSTCYALIAYHTAYLKANYPAEYMASVMSNNINNPKQITLFMEDCKNIGIDVLVPDINESQYDFAVNDKGQIRFGLGAIKGIGEGPSETICKERINGKFKNIFDFFERINSLQINRKVIENLIIAGAFDEVDEFHRAQYFAKDFTDRTNIEKLLKYGQHFQENKNSVKNSLFADMTEEIQIEKPKILPCDEWQNMHKLNKEKEIIGFYLSAHPMDEFKYQYLFLQGALSRKQVMEEKLLDHDNITNPIDDSVSKSDLDDSNNDNFVEKIQPKGHFSFLNLDEIDNFRTVVTANQTQNDRNVKKYNKSIPRKKYTVTGLITEYVVRNGFRSGEKVAFITLEDCSGSYSFRLRDKDYMRLKDKIDTQRFVILKISFSVTNKGTFVNIEDIIELHEAFEKLAKSMTLVLPIEDLRQEDVKFIEQTIFDHKGTHTLNFYLKSAEYDSVIELTSLQHKVEISPELLEIFHQIKKYKLFLN